jgi:hypothetical protein
VKVFNYESTKCTICCEEPPAHEVIDEMLEQAFAAHGEFETLTYHEDNHILIVNNYGSLALAYRGMINQTSLGIDLEGRLRAGGSINLIQIAAESTIYIFDIHQMEKLS